VSQAELARRMGTTQSAVARLEAGRQSPSFRTMQRAFGALGRQLEVVAHSAVSYNAAVPGGPPIVAEARGGPYGQAAIDAVDVTQIRAGRRRTPDDRLRHLAGASRGLRRLLDGTEP
jgi:transcriptional regulator with XRE-family HTH domain